MKKLVINCTTGEHKMVNLTAEEIANIPIRQAEAAEREVEMERELKISAEMRRVAEESCVEKGLIEP